MEREEKRCESRHDDVVVVVVVVAWCAAARRSPGHGHAAAPPTQPRPPYRGRARPINTSARARGAAEIAERGRSRPSPGTRGTEFPTAGGVTGGSVVQEWSPSDVWYRNRECDRGIKRGPGVFSFSLARSDLTFVRVSSPARADIAQLFIAVATREFFFTARPSPRARPLEPVHGSTRIVYFT